MNEEPTFSLEELGEIKTVRVYNQAYVDKQQKRIETLKRENAEMKGKLEKIKNYLAYEIPHELINEATTIIYKMV